MPIPLIVWAAAALVMGGCGGMMMKEDTPDAGGKPPPTPEPDKCSEEELNYKANSQRTEQGKTVAEKRQDYFISEYPFFNQVKCEAVNINPLFKSNPSLSYSQLNAETKSIVRCEYKVPDDPEAHYDLSKASNAPGNRFGLVDPKDVISTDDPSGKLFSSIEDYVNNQCPKK